MRGAIDGIDTPKCPRCANSGPVLPMADSDLSAAAPTLGLDLTPDCHDGEEHTVAQTEGPYFKPNAPLKRDLAVDAPRANG